MSLASAADLHAARAALEDAALRLTRARDELVAVRRSADRLADETAWQTPAARGFRERAAGWHLEVAHLEADAERARDLLWWARSELEATSWAQTP